MAKRNSIEFFTDKQPQSLMPRDKRLICTPTRSLDCEFRPASFSFEDVYSDSSTCLRAALCPFGASTEYLLRSRSPPNSRIRIHHRVLSRQRNGFDVADSHSHESLLPLFPTSFFAPGHEFRLRLVFARAHDHKHEPGEPRR